MERAKSGLEDKHGHEVPEMLRGLEDCQDHAVQPRNQGVQYGEDI